jgi:hypothetical protein
MLSYYWQKLDEFMKAGTFDKVANEFLS